MNATRRCRVQEWTETFPGTVESVRLGRAWLRAQLHGAGVADSVTETALLLLSELASNAVRHTASGRVGEAFHVAVRVDSSAVRLEVSDRGGTLTGPHLVEGDPLATAGRGLVLVADCSRRWGYRGGTSGRTVFAEVARGFDSAERRSMPPAQPGWTLPGATMGGDLGGLWRRAFDLSPC